MAVPAHATGAGRPTSFGFNAVRFATTLATAWLVSSIAAKAQDATPPAVMPQFPAMTWTRSLPIDPTSMRIDPIGGTEVRALAVMDGRLYAANGYWRDSAQADPNLPGPQVLVLDSPSGTWTVDGSFDDRIASGDERGLRRYQAIGALAVVRFDADRDGNPLEQPRSVLLASVWDRLGGLRIFSKVGPTGRWSPADLVPAAPPGSQVRSFGFHKDAVTGLERVFAGTNPDGIISGVYDPTGAGRILWDAAPEAGLPALKRAQRIMSFAECDGVLFATVGWDIYERQDGHSPAWRKVFTWGDELPFNGSGGLRGLTAVADPAEPRQDLLFVAEGRQGRIVRVDPRHAFAAVEELDVNAFLTRLLGTPVVASITAYNGMTTYREDNVAQGRCPDLLLGGFDAKTPEASNTVGANHKATGASFLVRDCRGHYTSREIADKSLKPEPPLVATRALVVSPFVADPPGTLYAGGFDAGNIVAHNSAWLYRGVPGSRDRTNAAPE